MKTNRVTNKVNNKVNKYFVVSFNELSDLKQADIKSAIYEYLVDTDNTDYIEYIDDMCNSTCVEWEIPVIGNDCETSDMEGDE
jgi:hypothetical protein